MRFRELMEANRNELARLVTEEHGKTLADAGGSVQRGIEVIEFAMAYRTDQGEYSEEVGTGVDTHSLRQPLACAPHHAVQFSGDGAVVDVPGRAGVRQYLRAETVGERPFRIHADGEAAQGCRIAGRCIQCRARRQGAVDALLHHPGIKAISFVGSTPIAKYIYETAASCGKRVQALGGAKNHAVVLPDMTVAADLEFTADALIGAAYGSAGSAAWPFPQ